MTDDQPTELALDPTLPLLWEAALAVKDLRLELALGGDDGASLEAYALDELGSPMYTAVVPLSAFPSGARHLIPSREGMVYLHDHEAVRVGPEGRAADLAYQLELLAAQNRPADDLFASRRVVLVLDATMEYGYEVDGMDDMLRRLLNGDQPDRRLCFELKAVEVLDLPSAPPLRYVSPADLYSVVRQAVADENARR